MSEDARRVVGERGQVTIPKTLRERFGIQGGDEVEIHEVEGRLVIERPVAREDLAAGYRERANRNRKLAESMAGVSQEANEHLGDAPEW